MSLSAKQLAFVEEYLKDLNGRQAALRAGYSPNACSQQASALLANPKVKSLLAKRIEQRSKETKIDANWVLQKLGEWFDADIADIMTDGGAYKPVKEWPPVWRKMLNGMDVREVFNDGTKSGEVLKIRFIDRLRALELIGKHIDVQAFKERHEVEGPITVVFGKEDEDL